MMTRQEQRKRWCLRTARYKATHRARIAAVRHDHPEWNARASKIENHGRSVANTAVVMGRLIPLPCEICGEPRVEKHHPFGYLGDMALAVWWLCMPHHKAMHVAIRAV